MLSAGTLSFEVVAEKKTLKLKVDSKSFGLQTDTTPDQLLRVAAYLTSQAERVANGKENGR